MCIQGNTTFFTGSVFGNKKKAKKKKSSTPDQPLGVTMQILTRAEAMFCYLLHFKVAYPQALKLLCEQF